MLAGVSYTGSEIINVHKTKEQREHNKTLFPNPNQNNNGSFVLRHLSPVHESLPKMFHRLYGHFPFTTKATQPRPQVFSVNGALPATVLHF